MIYVADLSSLLRDSTVIEEEERRGSSSDSSTCLVGTTTQGLDSAAPRKGKNISCEHGGVLGMQTQHVDVSSVIRCPPGSVGVKGPLYKRRSGSGANLFRLHHCWCGLEVSDWVCFDRGEQVYGRVLTQTWRERTRSVQAAPEWCGLICSHRWSTVQSENPGSVFFCLPVKGRSLRLSPWWLQDFNIGVNPFSSSAPCRIPEVFRLAGAFADQPERQPAVRLRLRLPQVGLSRCTTRRRPLTAEGVGLCQARVEPGVPPSVFWINAVPPGG